MTNRVSKMAGFEVDALKRIQDTIQLLFKCKLKEWYRCWNIHVRLKELQKIYVFSFLVVYLTIICDKMYFKRCVLLRHFILYEEKEVGPYYKGVWDFGSCFFSPMALRKGSAFQIGLWSKVVNQKFWFHPWYYILFFQKFWQKQLK